MECVWRTKGNAITGKCMVISCIVSLFLVKIDIFMAAICDMALGRLADGRYFLGIVHD